MANTRGIRRVMGANAAQWSQSWGDCQWPKGCDRPAEYRNQLWSMRVVETCAAHTPRDPQYRLCARPEEEKRIQRSSAAQAALSRDLEAEDLGL